MSRSRRSWAIALILVLSLRPVRGICDSAETLALDVVLNGYDTGRVIPLRLVGATIDLSCQDMVRIGLRPASERHGRCTLERGHGLSWIVDEATQTLRVKATRPNLLAHLVRSGRASRTHSRIEEGLGATLNYDVTGIRFDDHDEADGLFNLRLFSPDGAISADALTFFDPASAQLGDRFIRLDTTYTWSSPSRLVQTKLGDFIQGGLSWSRSVRMTGIQITSDFNLRPDLVTYPLPSVFGSIAVPSAATVFVNQTSVLSAALPPGPFEIQSIPVVTGEGTIAVQTVNALGQQTIVTVPFYASDALLKPGLQSYSVEAGLVRLGWGVVSNDYGDFAGSETYRRGLSDWITFEEHTEGTSGLMMGGGGFVANLLNTAVLQVDMAISTGSGAEGNAEVIGISHNGRILNWGASAEFSSRNFEDVAAVNGQPVPYRQIMANTGFNLGRYGSFGVAYSGFDTRAYSINPNLLGSLAGGQAFNGIIQPQPAEHAHIISATYSIQRNGVDFYATGYRDLALQGGTGFFFGVTVPLGSRRSVSAGIGGSSGLYGQAQAQQSIVSPGQFGYQIDQSTQEPANGSATASYESNRGLLSIGVGRIGAQTTARAEVSGALSVVDNQIFASNTINDSFAVVDTGVPKVEVFSENRPVGVTNPDGTILVPNLISFGNNKISINPLDAPFDATLPYTERNVIPGYRAGVVVRFPMKSGDGALVTFIKENGKPTPVGSIVHLARTGAEFPVGYDGQAYITGLVRGINLVSIVKPHGGRCLAKLLYRGTTAPLQKIGPVRCAGR